MAYPRLLIDRRKLTDNLNLLADLCHSQGMSMAAVSKGAAAHPAIVEAINASRADFLADARLKNLELLHTDKPRMLIRIAMPSEIPQLVRCAEMSLQSESSTIRLLGAEALRQGRRHQVVLMVDLGDLREGIFFRNEEELRAAARAVLDEPALELLGLGVNFSCFAGVLPDQENVSHLLRLAQMLRQEFGVPLPLVSGGATSTLGPLLRHELPSGLTNLRLGEAFLVAYDSSGQQALNTLPGLEGLADDALTLEAELVEVQRKPSVPVGRVGLNAFGEPMSFQNKGEMLRGVAALGRQDTDLDRLIPLEPGVEILGGSSDHLVLDITRRPKSQPGDVLRFRLTYGAMLKAFTSRYIDKIVL